MTRPTPDTRDELQRKIGESNARLAVRAASVKTLKAAYERAGHDYNHEWTTRQNLIERLRWLEPATPDTRDG